MWELTQKQLDQVRRAPKDKQQDIYNTMILDAAENFLKRVFHPANTFYDKKRRGIQTHQ